MKSSRESAGAPKTSYGAVSHRLWMDTLSWGTVTGSASEVNEDML